MYTRVYIYYRAATYKEHTENVENSKCSKEERGKRKIFARVYMRGSCEPQIYKNKVILIYIYNKGKLLRRQCG